MRCPICSASMAVAFSMHGHEVFQCGACGHQAARPLDSAAHVASVYDDAYFFGGGAGYRDYPADGWLVRAHGRRHGRALKKRVSLGRLLDVGSAAGFLLQGLSDESWSGVGLEPNARMAGLARAQGQEVVVGTLERPPEALRALGPFDGLVMVQVVAHFHDIERAFANAAALTRPGGFWLIETWDRASLTARLFGRGWHEYSPPSVLHWFDRKGLARLARRFGFELVAQGRPGKWISGGHARSLVRYKLEATQATRWLAPITGLLPERLPLPYPAEDLFWALFRGTHIGNDEVSAQSDPAGS